jgi:hypothetical protein
MTAMAACEGIEGKLVGGGWAARRDGRHWCALVPDCEKHKLVRVCAGPGEVIPRDVCWHLAIPEGTRCKDGEVWLHFGLFPCRCSVSEWRSATAAEIAKQEDDERAGMFVWEGSREDAETRRGSEGRAD